MKDPTEFLAERKVVNEDTKRLAIEKFREHFYSIKEVLGNYLDIPDNYKTIATLWILGTYVHKEFRSYPFLFINAMKGSGKTRFLKLIEAMCWNGKITNNLSEAVLFRTASNNSILIDEFEGVSGKNANTLRELLNSAYKKGSKVERMRKITSREGETHVIESFEVYTPVVMANIWGMNEVLGDRCITLILEKSNDMRVTKLVENFDEDEKIRQIKADLLVYLVQLCSFFGENRYNSKWNNFVNSLYTYTYTTLTTQTTQTTQVLNSSDIDFFEKVNKTKVNGRDLELFFPLFIVAKEISDEVLEETLTIAKDYIESKRDDEMMESRDVSLIDFVSKKGVSLTYYPIIDLTREFKMFFQGEDAEEMKWLNQQWMGRALKRLNLILDKRRLSHGIEVSLNITRAKEKMKSMKVKDADN